MYQEGQNDPCNVQVAELTKSFSILYYTKVLKFLETSICSCFHSTRRIAGSLAGLSSECL